MTSEIKRQVELFLVDRLKAALPLQTFVPLSGGDQFSGPEEIEPPFTVISIIDAARTMATEGTWYCHGAAQVISHHTELKAQDQAEMAREVYKALDNIGTYATPLLSIHGLDIIGMTSAVDDQLGVHADVISFTLGAGG